jgi:hypothetical protein
MRHYEYSLAGSAAERMARNVEPFTNQAETSGRSDVRWQRREGTEQAPGRPCRTNPRAGGFRPPAQARATPLCVECRARWGWRPQGSSACSDCTAEFMRRQSLGAWHRAARPASNCGTPGPARALNADSMLDVAGRDQLRTSSRPLQSCDMPGLALRDARESCCESRCVSHAMGACTLRATSAGLCAASSHGATHRLPILEAPC